MTFDNHRLGQCPNNGLFLLMTFYQFHVSCYLKWAGVISTSRFVVSCSLGRVGFDVFRLRQPRLIPNYGASLLLFHRPSGVRISPCYSVAHAIAGCGVRRTSDSLPLRLREPRHVFQNHRLTLTAPTHFKEHCSRIPEQPQPAGVRGQIRERLEMPRRSISSHFKYNSH